MGNRGIRKGFELACESLNIKTKCVFTSEIKESAIKILQQNYPGEKIYGDITKIEATNMSDFAFLVTGFFFCQVFSFASKRLGVQETRGTLFFEVERIFSKKKLLFKD